MVILNTDIHIGCSRVPTISLTVFSKACWQHGQYILLILALGSSILLALYPTANPLRISELSYHRAEFIAFRSSIHCLVCLTCVKQNWPIIILRSESGGRYSKSTKTITGSPFSRSAQSLSFDRAPFKSKPTRSALWSLGITQMESLFAGYLFG